MKAVYPVTRQNSALYGQLALLFAKIGPQRDHHLLLVACPSALEAAQEFAESVKRLFGTCEIHQTASEIEPGNSGRNRMFKDAVGILDKTGNTSPWIWMENAYPLDRDWLSMVQDEWNAKPTDRLFLGCIENAYREANEAEIKAAAAKGLDIRGSFKNLGKYMRFGVYPANFSRVCPEYRYTEGRPFEVDLGGPISGKCHESKVLATLWPSRNYTVNNGTYSGELTPGLEPEIRKSAKSSISYGNLAVLHGCRDASLGLLLIRKDWSRKRETARPAHRAPTDGKELEEAQETIAMLAEQLAAAQEKLAAQPAPEASEPASDPREADTAPITPTAPTPAPAAVVSTPTPERRRPGRPKKSALQPA